MYERNAIVIDRYFSNIFEYDKKNNIKVNGNNYFELVDVLEKYQEASEIENNIMDEYEKTANKIKEIQKIQEGLNKKNLKYFESRKSLFENLDEDEEELKNEKSEIRSKCGRERRIIENDYQRILNLTTENYKNLLKEKLREMKSFLKTEDKEEIKEQMKEKIQKNGAKEKVPFDSNVIDTSLYIEGKKAEILLSIYDKTTKLLDEIKNDTVKIVKHKKQVKDSKSKLEFLNVITEYIILFLDNERMNTIGGETEHKKVMSEACDNLQNDLIEIQNMYSLLIKEINGKSTKKSYKELYNIDYLNALKEKEINFEKNISKLNMTGTVIYPDYWRIEGMQKIYDTFRTIMTDVYEVDLSEYEPLDITFEVKENVLENEIDKVDEKNDEEIPEKEEDIADKEIDEKKEITLKFDNSEEDDNIKIIESEIKKEDEDEFHWDEDDENDELIFDSKNSIIENDEKEEEQEIETEDELKIENNEEEDERDKEIDELLGIFDTEESEEDDVIEEHILQIEDDELDDSIFANDENENTPIEKNKKEDKEKPKRKSLFGRRK